ALLQHVALYRPSQVEPLADGARRRQELVRGELERHERDPLRSAAREVGEAARPGRPRPATRPGDTSRTARLRATRGLAVVVPAVPSPLREARRRRAVAEVAGGVDRAHL